MTLLQLLAVNAIMPLKTCSFSFSSSSRLLDRLVILLLLFLLLLRSW
jgi:hypothetical protein